MANAQKPDLVFRRNGRVHLNRWRASVQLTTGSRGVRISGSNAGYTVFRGSVKGTGYPLHSPVFPSLSLPCVTVCHHISDGAYLLGADNFVSDVKCKKQLFKRVSILKNFSHFQVQYISLSSHAQSLLKADQFCVILLNHLPYIIRIVAFATWERL